jgi:hypothetical protein
VRRWWTKDDLVTFHKKEEGWIVGTYSAPICKAFEGYGITSPIEGEHTYFPSLKAAQQAVNDVSLEAGLNIDSRLTRQGWTAYKIGDLPLAIRREKDHWRVLNVPSAPLSPSLERHFNSTKEFRDTWYATGLSVTHYPTRKAAHQAVINGLSQTIAEGK